MEFEIEEPGVLFDFVAGKSKQGQVGLRVCGMVALEEIFAKTRGKKVEYKVPVEGGPLQRFEFVEVNEDLENDMILDYTITDLVNAKVGGKVLECNLESKKLLMKSRHFLSVYNKGLKTINAENKKLYGDGDEQGNSGSTQ